MKVIFENRRDVDAQSLGCHAVTNIAYEPFYYRIRSHNNLFLSVFATCFPVFVSYFSLKSRFIIFLTEDLTV